VRVELGLGVVAVEGWDWGSGVVGVELGQFETVRG
jgi:hypothetical protein